jgi:Family of unknown function (DUF6134)
VIRSLAALLVFALVGSAAADGVPPDGRLEFAAFRQGSEIGRGVYRFSGDPAHREVAIAVDIQVKIAFITVYRFTHRAHELWDGARLVRMDAETDDNGTARSVQVLRAGERLAITADGRASDASPDAVPLSFWHRGIMTAPEIIDPVDGAVFGLTVRRDPGPGESYEIRNEAGLRRRITYDADGILAGFRLWAHDGSEVEYRRVGSTPAR